MFYEIFSLLLEFVSGLVAGACLLRMYMQYQRIPMSARSGNPLAAFVFALTNWVVLPLRRALPSAGSLDTASLAAAFVLEMLQFFLLWLAAGASGSLGSIPVLAVFGVARLALSGMTGLVIVYAVLSWVPARSPMSDVIERLVSPVLSPIRRVLPLLGGIDVSPLALLLLLQVAGIVLGHLQALALI
ncbi:MAG: hypothetical protein RJA34_1458 [Pseudomonadota bacterium]|jgi:YggT family protein